MRSATMEDEGTAQMRLEELSGADAPLRQSPTCLAAVPDTGAHFSDSQPNGPCNAATMDDTEHPPDERELLEEDDSYDEDNHDLLRDGRWLKSKW